MALFAKEMERICVWYSSYQPSANLQLYKTREPSNYGFMSDVINKAIVLSLNSHWMPIGILTVAEAVIALSGSGENGGHPAYAMDIDFGTDEDGQTDMGKLTNASPTPWEKWIMLPVRPIDLFIQTARGKIRAPTVVIQRNYDKVPLKKPRLSHQAIWERDNGTCQYSGRKLTRRTANLDHVIPKSRGGKDAWENIVLADVAINTAKGNRLNGEAGLKLLRRPVAPPSIPVSVSIHEPRHPSWEPFLIRK